MNSLYRYEIANEEDFTSIALLVNNSYWMLQSPYFIDSPKSRTRIDQTGLMQISADSSKQLIKMVDLSLNTIAGVVVVSYPPNETYATFEMFSLDTAYRGKKIGSELIQYVESLARNHNRTTMQIEVFTFAEKLASYYIRNGYLPKGEKKSFFHSDCIKEEFQSSDGLYLVPLSKDLKTIQ